MTAPPPFCEPGAGGVTIKNDLTEIVSTCRTDYPGTESMVIPAIAQPGEEVTVTNPIQDNYYVWDGKSTSAQYYVNKKGLGPKDACVWNSPSDPTGAGNWSPIILGVGKASDGITYLSIFQNAPTSTAQLDFNIEITGDVNSKCSYINGQWTGGSSGCTVSQRPRVSPWCLQEENRMLTQVTDRYAVRRQGYDPLLLSHRHGAHF